MSVLYLCYLSLLEPLTQTQVLAYLEGLATDGYRVHILTFEPRPLSADEVAEWHERLAAIGITWYRARYHKRPTVPATAFDILVGIARGFLIAKRHKVALLHARGYVPGVMCLVLKPLTGARFLFDVRGFWAEEMVDAGSWPAGSPLFHVTKWMERLMARSADGFVVLTERARRLFLSWYESETAGKPLEVIPCCVDVDRIAYRASATRVPGEELTLAYVGKVGGWYLFDEMAAFVRVARETTSLRWNIWTQSEFARLQPAIAANGLSDVTHVGYVTPRDLAHELVRTDAGLALIRPSLSKISSSPTKVGEYLASGIPVVSTTGIGDVDELLTADPEYGTVGVLVRTLDDGGYRDALGELRALLADGSIRERCRQVARKHLDLKTVGWPGYRRLYAAVLGKGSTEPAREAELSRS